MLLRHRQSTTPDHAGISQFSAEAEIAQKYRKAINFLSDAETKITFFHVDSAVLRFSEIYVDVAVIIYSTWVFEGHAAKNAGAGGECIGEEEGAPG